MAMTGCPPDRALLIVIDTSALMAVILDEPTASQCISILAAEPDLLISAGTLAEALIVADRRNAMTEMTRLIDGLGMTVVAITAAAPQRIAAAYRRWGKGVHPAGLNFGDCFAYDLAHNRNCPLLYVGKDFAQTDIKAAMPV